jgi:hypothetical protein
VTRTFFTATGANSDVPETVAQTKESRPRSGGPDERFRWWAGVPAGAMRSRPERRVDDAETAILPDPPQTS